MSYLAHIFCPILVLLTICSFCKERHDWGLQTQDMKCSWAPGISLWPELSYSDEMVVQSTPKGIETTGGDIQGLYRDNGKEEGSHYSGFWGIRQIL